MSFTSDEVNYLVYRYLQESGFQHAAFALSNESHLHKSNINTVSIPPGGLISILQKGLQYIDVEWHMTEDGTEVGCDETPTLLSALGPKPAPSSEPKRKDRDRDRERERERERDREKDRDSKRDRKESRGDKDKKRSKVEPEPAPGVTIAEPEEPEPAPPAEATAEIPQSEVTVLVGHESEVFICSWNPHRPLLASGSGDATAIIWDIPLGPTGQSSPSPTSVVLQHFDGTQRVAGSSKDVTTLDWSPNGTLLATGSYDGQARIWNEKGQLVNTLSRHKGPIFALKWNKQGDSLLSGSVDKTAVIWDASSGEVRQQFEYHNGATLDVDWRDNTSFASCSTDNLIYVCRQGETKPIKTFRGHTSEVNAVKWDPTGVLLASCSDDNTAKVWSMSSEQCVLDFREHNKEIYTIKWNPTANVLLATASFDTTVKLWDANIGRCVHTLAKHREPVYSLAFSPDGRYVASGSFDCQLNIWSVKDGTLVKTFRGNGGIFDVSWTHNGNKIAACLSNNTVCVMDVRL